MSWQGNVFAGAVLCHAIRLLRRRVLWLRGLASVGQHARATDSVCGCDRSGQVSDTTSSLQSGPKQRELPRVLRKLETSGLFTQEPPLAENTGILIFRRVEGVLTLFDHINRGRALSDRGLHDQAVADLQEATVLGPSNVEAWANLAYAYERAGRFQEAISAGARSRELSPRHYYVNLGLARVSFQLEEWRDVVDYAREAASDAPTAADRTNAWALAARGAYRSGDSQLGCEFLRRAGLTTNDDRVPEASSHTCDQ
jgi:tetratricopeptide (TPR) repeat protein